MIHVVYSRPMKLKRRFTISSRSWRQISSLSGIAQRDMGACPPVVAGNSSKYTIFAVLIFFVYFVQSNIQQVSPASGSFHRGSTSVPCWGTSVHQTLLLSPISKFLATPRDNWFQNTSSKALVTRQTKNIWQILLGPTGIYSVETVLFRWLLIKLENAECGVP